jgi:shikimate kinase
METNVKLKLFLVGYMGAGKTTVGKLLAEKLNWSFIDVDWFIENRYCQPIATIFEEKGESGFREIERRTLVEISNFEKVVISTGGGLPCFFDNMDIMNRTGITIYLKSNVDKLIGRLDLDKQKRPLIKEKNLEELQDFVEKNLEKREPFYSRAKLILDVPHCSSKKEMNQWVDEISLQIYKFLEIM